MNIHLKRATLAICALTVFCCFSTPVVAAKKSPYASMQKMMQKKDYKKKKKGMKCKKNSRSAKCGHVRDWDNLNK